VVHVRGATETDLAHAHTDVAARTQVTVIGPRSGCASDAVTIEVRFIAEGRRPWATESAEWPCLTLVFNPRNLTEPGWQPGLHHRQLVVTPPPPRLVGYWCGRDRNNKKWPDPAAMAALE
jgi:hypothetical protein